MIIVILHCFVTLAIQTYLNMKTCEIWMIKVKQMVSFENVSFTTKILCKFTELYTVVI